MPLLANRILADPCHTWSLAFCNPVLILPLIKPFTRRQEATRDAF